MSNSYINSISSDYTLEDGYDTFLIDATTSNIIVTLPTSYAVANGTQIIFRRIDNNYNNTVTLVGQGGELIDSNVTSLLNPNSNIKINSFNNSWYIVTGGSKGNEIDISFSQLVGTQSIRPYLLMTNQVFTSLGFFKYKGSAYYGTIPLKFEITYSIDSSVSVSVDFSIQLQDLTNVKIISTVGPITQTGDNSMLYSAFTTIFANVNANEAIIEIDGKLNSGSGNVRLNSINLILS